MKFEMLYTIQPKKVLAAWGDYGSTLAHGLGERDEHVFRLSRTGPFVPPFTFPGFGNVIVTNSTKQSLENSGLTGVGGFVPVFKEKAVKIHWHLWNFQLPLDRTQMPPNGEPEEYLLGNPNDPSTMCEIGELWSWEPQTIGHLGRRRSGLRFSGIYDHDLDVFRIRDEFYRDIFVNEKAVQVIAPIGNSWIGIVLFEP